MKKIESIVSNTIFSLLVLLTLLLIFEDYVQIPILLQPIGRMHPLMLHFPIGFIVLLVLLNVFREQLDELSFEKINKFLLLLTSLSTVLATLMGFFLSQESGYTPEGMIWHKWSGILVCYVTYLLILSYRKRNIYKVLLYGVFVGTVVAGHFGASLTHGDKFLIEPILKSEQKEIDKNAPIFEAYVQPILETKCKSCHNAEKHKGDLDMSTLEKLHKGGENGPIWIKGDIENSELIRRALLPIADEDHMPPEGKAQLTTAEFAFIKKWIERGADEHISLRDLASSDSLVWLATSAIENKETGEGDRKYSFDFVSKETIASLNNPYRSILQIAPTSPALEVSIYGKEAFKLEYLTELIKIKEQIVALNLSYLPIKDEALDVISKLVNLEKLNLNFTEITGQNLNKLAACPNLKSLSLSGTKTTSSVGNAISDFANLREVFLWNTNLSSNDIASLQKDYPSITFLHGYDADKEEAMKLSPPILENKNIIITPSDAITLLHKLNGVKIRYTVDNSEPNDTSALYTKALHFDKSTVLKTKAYKDNWKPSEVRKFSFIKQGIQPDTIELIHQPDKKYSASGPMSLIDNKRGKMDDMPLFYWLGFMKDPLIALLDFGVEPPTLRKMDLSYGITTWQRIMPPKSIEIWGGNNKRQMFRLATSNLSYKKDEPARDIKSIELTFEASEYRFYKVIVNPVDKLPSWHGSKGENGWVFVDEMFFY